MSPPPRRALVLSLIESVARIDAAVASIDAVPVETSVQASDEGRAAYMKLKAARRRLDKAKAAVHRHAIAGKLRVEEYRGLAGSTTECHFRLQLQSLVRDALLEARRLDAELCTTLTEVIATLEGTPPSLPPAETDSYARACTDVAAGNLAAVMGVFRAVLDWVLDFLVAQGVLERRPAVATTPVMSLRDEAQKVEQACDSFVGIFDSLATGCGVRVNDVKLTAALSSDIADDAGVQHAAMIHELGVAIDALTRLAALSAAPGAGRYGGLHRTCPRRELPWRSPLVESTRTRPS